MGLERTGGFETVAFCEICPKARKVLSKHWPNIKQYDDIKDLNNDKLIADGIEADVITGGFPCQDISSAGKGKGIKAERSGLWSEMFRLIGDVRPTWAIIENVSALRSKGLTLVLQNLSEIGYMCQWHCIPASAVGAPHQRDRIWIVANPQRNGFSPDTFTRSNEETIRQESSRQDNPLDSQRTSCLSTTNANVADTISKSERMHTPRTLHDWQPNDRQKRGTVGSFFAGLCQTSTKTAGHWAIEPNVGRVADGVPNRVDRLKQLGNSVVPQIPELIGNAILEVEG